MAQTIKIPDRFIDDHFDRCLPTPEDIGSFKNHSLFSVDDPALPELLSDAEHYAVMTERHGRHDCMPRGLVASAAATVRAIRDVIGWDNAPADVLRLRKRG
jgi:hypothetical protein